ncbi:hypothetical protein ACI77J_14700 [Pseudomonas sp. O64]|uniref:hypothetical protein n=1 Tax=unclassified Pseudomonas TaxID=196821 RepID=UPI00387B997D
MKDAVLGVEKFTVEVAGVFKADLKRLMRQHGFNNQQEVFFQNLLRNVIAADFETAAQLLRCVTTPFVVSEKVSRTFEAACSKQLEDDPGEPEDQLFQQPVVTTSA